MPMDSACGNAALPALGFPIRESADHRLFSAYPRLIAAVHALHRLLVPRHPPCALLILTVITRSTRRRARGDTRYIGKTVQFSRTAQRRRPDWPPVSQNSTACEAPATRARACVPIRSTLLGPGRSSRCGMQLEGDPGAPNPGGFPRKEVIQPHLPVRLPCYDFTPVTSPTFDGSLPEGLGHRLRVLLASVV